MATNLQHIGLNQSQFAELMGVNRSQVTLWIKKGMPTTEFGIDPETAKSWVDRAIDPATRHALRRQKEAPSDTDSPDLTLERALLARAQREGQAMKNAVLRGELIPLEVAQAVAGTMIDAVRAKILAIPTKSAPVLAGKTSLAEIKAILTDHVTEACDELSSDAALMAEILQRSRAKLGLRVASEDSAGEDEASAKSNGKRVGGRISGSKSGSERGAG